MQNYLSYIAAIVMMIFISACSDENPSNVFVNQSSEASSSSFFEDYSSSANIPGLSSSETISSNNELSSSSWEPYSYGELIDKRDKHVYKTIKIGEQTWMAENLNYAYLQPTSTEDSSSICFNNEPDTCAKYGRLYLWSAAMDSAGIFSLDGKGCGLGSGSCKAQPSKGVRGVCPENWHIPNESDIKNIIDYSKVPNDKLIWLEHYWFLTENEDNEFKTEMELRYDSFWTSEQLDKGNAKGLYFKPYKISTNSTPKAVAYPVRCVKDDEKFHVEHGELKDERDGQVYKTVKIGDQWWMAENLNYAYLPPNDSTTATSMCYNDVPDSCTKYGRLYMWEAAMNCSSLKYSFCNEDVYESEQYSKTLSWSLP